MKKTVLIFLLLSTSALAAHPSAQQLTDQIKQKGAQAVISDLYKDNENQWQYVTQQIASGKREWLDVAALLVHGSDADSAETLTQAVGAAIPHNPSGVLSVITEKYVPLSLEEVCGLPFYSLSEPQLNQYVMDSIRALYKVPSGKACLDIMVNVIGASDGFNKDN